jgi:hypothetical protein
MSKHVLISLLLITALSVACGSAAPTVNPPPIIATEPPVVTDVTEAVPATEAPQELLPPTTVLTEPPVEGPSLVFIGMPDPPILEEIDAIHEATGYRTTVNSDVSSADLVLFTVHAPDGPMPATREAIEDLRGQTLHRAAILLTGVELVDDAELIELEGREVVSFLSDYMDPSSAGRLRILHSNDPDLPAQLEALLDTIRPNIVMDPVVSPTAAAAIALVGSSTIEIGQAAQAIEDQSNHLTVVNGDAEGSNLVLFTVTAVDGPMVRTVNEIKKRQGQTFSRAAIFIVRTADLDDNEILQLVELEMRELLAGYMDPALAEQMPILHDNNPDLVQEIDALLDSPPSNILIGPQ